MVLRLEIPPQLPDGMSSRELTQAAARGISNALKRHFRAKNQSAKHRNGMPRSNFWSKVADATQTTMEGNTAVVLVDHEGVLLHLEGGTIYPKAGRKALAIPLVAAVWDQNPREYDSSREKLSLVWPKGSSAGTLRDKETGEAWYLLVAKANIPRDPGVVPADEELVQAGFDAMEALS